MFVIKTENSLYRANELGRNELGPIRRFQPKGCD